MLAIQHLGTAEDVVELAEADGALQVRAAVLGTLRLERRRAEVWGGDDYRQLVGGGCGGGRVGVHC